MGFMFYRHNSGTCRRKRSQFLFGEESELGIPVHIRRMEDQKWKHSSARLKRQYVYILTDAFLLEREEVSDISKRGLRPGNRFMECTVLEASTVKFCLGTIESQGKVQFKKSTRVAMDLRLAQDCN